MSLVHEDEIRQIIQSFCEAWNKHNYKTMASFWAEDGDLINPWGLWGKGRAEVEKLFLKEQNGIMCKSTCKQEVLSARLVHSEAIITDVKAHISNAMTPQGAKISLLEHHIVYLFIKHNDRWEIASSRAYQLLGRLSVKE